YAFTEQGIYMLATVLKGEVVRVLKPGGPLFASVLHPCFDGNYDTGIGRQGQGIERQVIVKNYFEPREWEKRHFIKEQFL
ncbi:hypothetical protein CSX02_05250, partial [Agathobacter ruminis]